MSLTTAQRDRLAEYEWSITVRTLNTYGDKILREAPMTIRAADRNEVTEKVRAAFGAKYDDYRRLWSHTWVLRSVTEVRPADLLAAETARADKAEAERDEARENVRQLRDYLSLCRREEREAHRIELAARERANKAEKERDHYLAAYDRSDHDRVVAVDRADDAEAALGRCRELAETWDASAIAGLADGGAPTDYALLGVAHSLIAAIEGDVDSPTN